MDLLRNSWVRSAKEGRKPCQADLAGTGHGSWSPWLAANQTEETGVAQLHLLDGVKEDRLEDLGAGWDEADEVEGWIKEARDG